jgi:hypothetical protein
MVTVIFLAIIAVVGSLVEAHLAHIVVGPLCHQFPRSIAALFGHVPH